MPRKGSTGARSICSKCGNSKNPSGYCPTCYQLKKSTFSTPAYTSTVQQRGNTCSKCGFIKNPSGYCPTCYRIKKNNAYQPTSGYTFSTKDSCVAAATCSKCGCIKNSSGDCPTCYQLKKKTQSKNQSSTPVAKTASTSIKATCSKCGYEKNSSGYCPTCYQRKKQEREEYAVYETNLADDFIIVGPPQEESTRASLNEDFLLASIPIKKTTPITRENESGYITSEFEDSLLSTNSSPERKTASPITLTITEQANPDISTKPAVPNESTPTETTTISEKPTTTSNSATETTQTTLMQDEKFWLVSAIPPSIQPISTAPVTITLLEKESIEWTYISKRMLQTMPQTTIQGIYKVYNEWLMERYKLAKRRMLCKYNNDIKEQILFHGTSKASPSKIIYSEFGFDFRHCSKGLWGIGTYFATNADYSNSYSYKPAGKGYREILAAWVLTGESYRCEQDETLRKPPAKSPDSDASYDTVCGHTAGSNVYIVYDHEKAYPSYIIRYTV